MGSYPRVRIEGGGRTVVPQAGGVLLVDTGSDTAALSPKRKALQDKDAPVTVLYPPFPSPAQLSSASNPDHGLYNAYTQAFTATHHGQQFPPADATHGHWAVLAYDAITTAATSRFGITPPETAPPPPPPDNHHALQARTDPKTGPGLHCVVTPTLRTRTITALTPRRRGSNGPAIRPNRAVRSGWNMSPGAGPADDDSPAALDHRTRPVRTDLPQGPGRTVFPVPAQEPQVRVRRQPSVSETHGA
ncbi:hypothetical protein [Streptomyces sp. NPDC096013]|uniref:hypothetical protein n=1 Tax=Streptomyces sp. NPDC096013 TaxID=3366069 RepID=UPI003807DACF